ncbi:MAG: response regulator [Kofleriaceae bacterium]|nr:response regulator [Kofleriaceae bacterium]MCL4225743.1 hybrid sensor histidine kinase/response regulator [Myxococcales bacterium]
MSAYPAATDRAPLASSPATPSEDGPTSRQAPPTGVRVLIADDEPAIRRAVSSAMRRIGYEVRAVEDGAAAIALAEQTPFDLAFIDLTMPTGGLEVVARLKAMHGESIHVEILSGCDDPQVRIAAFDHGVDGYILKPISPAELQHRARAAARAQQAYISARQAREQADRLLAWGTEAASLLAHDLNNGLAVALSNMTYLSQTAEVGADQQEALTATVRALRRMAGLVSNFVDIARFEEDALRPRTGPVKLRELLLEVLAVHTPTLTRKIRHAVSCDPDIVGNFDEALIARALHNLVGNAARYCNAGGLIRVAAEEIVTPYEPARIEISVSNTGPAVPPAVVPKLFGKYALGKDGQRGLGLYFCRLACEAHGGTVRYGDGPEGPTFTIVLPAGQITLVG